MESAPPKPASLTSTVSEVLYECAVCSETFRDPVTTTCGHTFCKLCLCQWIQRGRATPPAKCPTCRQEINQDPATLHVSVIIADLVQAHVKRRADRASAAAAAAAAVAAAAAASAAAAAASSAGKPLPSAAEGKATVIQAVKQTSMYSSRSASAGKQSPKEDAAIAQIVGMGFAEDAARAALAASDWDTGAALEHLVGAASAHAEGSTALTPAQRASVASLTDLGLEAAAAQALLETCAWDLEAALAVSGLQD
jgi:hypothetical protein